MSQTVDRLRLWWNRGRWCWSRRTRSLPLSGVRDAGWVTELLVGLRLCCPVYVGPPWRMNLNSSGRKDRTRIPKGHFDYSNRSEKVSIEEDVH
jgi:hypothetical protein